MNIHEKILSTLGHLKKTEKRNILFFLADDKEFKKKLCKVNHIKSLVGRSLLNKERQKLEITSWFNCDTKTSEC